MGIARIANRGEREMGGRERPPGSASTPRSQPSAAPVVDDHAIERALDPRRSTMKRRRVETADGVESGEGTVGFATSRPRPLAEVSQDIPLDPREIFVLSFVDGNLDAREISDIVGLPRETVDAILERLALFGCITLE